MKSNKKLVIVESPAKTKTIEKFLGKNYTVVASMGHIRDLPSYYMGINVKDDFALKYELNKERKKLINDLIKKAKSSDCIYLAPDPDREGEAIAWHLYEVLKEYCQNFKRVIFNEITKKAVLTAFKKEGNIDMNKVNSQQARRSIDRLVGYSISPLLQSKKSGAKSAGRVQTVALRLIVQREKEIRAFIPEEYWSLKADVFNGDSNFEVQLAKINNEKVDISSEEEMKKVLKQLKNKKLIFQGMKTLSKKRNPSAPFITSTLQQAASSMLGISPSQTMRLAQQLYEGIEISEGMVGLITYMRTDSVRISNEAKNFVRDFISDEFGYKYLAPLSKSYKSSNSAQQAHEAIRPTGVVRTPNLMEPYLDTHQLKLYSLIWCRFVASQMSSAKFDQCTIELLNENNQETEYLFRATISKLIFPGFLKIYKEKKLKKEVNLPNLVKEQAYLVNKLLPKQHFTEPLPCFSEATLVKELEANNLGRPSTYASIVRRIQDRGYIEKEKGRLRPNKMGEEVCDYLVERFQELFAVKFTADMEEKLDLIENGKKNWKIMLKNFYASLQEWILNVKREDAVNSNKVIVLIEALLNSKISWKQPVKNGNKVYDEKKFVESLQEQTCKKENLFSEKQWFLLVKIFSKYLNEVSNSKSIIAKCDIKILMEKFNNQSKNSEKDVQRLTLLEGITFNEPITKGKKVYDDKKFYLSLKEQVNLGRNLSDRQLKAFIILIQKYQNQIDDLKAKLAKFSLEFPTQDERRYSGLKQFISLFDKIEIWAEPVSKGKRVYDDKKFIGSLRQQFENNRDLSDRQVIAAKTIMKKYGNFLDNYLEVLEKLNI